MTPTQPIANKPAAGFKEAKVFDTPSWAHWLVFSLSLSGISTIFVLSAIAALRDDFEFFPPPNKQSWQHKTFLGLFRLYIYPLIILTMLVFEPLEGTRVWVQYGVGSLLLLIGFGMAIRITLYMGGAMLSVKSLV